MHGSLLHRGEPTGLRLVEPGALVAVEPQLAHPGVGGLVQEGQSPLHAGLDGDGLAICHIQLHHMAAALDHIELLAPDVAVAVGDGLGAEGGIQEGLVVIEDAVGQVVDAQQPTGGQDDQAAKQEQAAFFCGVLHQGQDAQEHQHQRCHAVALLQPDGGAGAVLLPAAQEPGQALVDEVDHAEHGGGDQKIRHGQSSSGSAQSTMSTGMSNSSVSRCSTIWKP